MFYNSYFIPLVFLATVVLAVILFVKAVRPGRVFIYWLAAWVILQSVAGILGFYNDVHSATTRFPLLALPPTVALLACLATRRGKELFARADIRQLTLLHLVRVPVEFVLLGLYLHQGLPQAMTFSGRNFDILSGLSAPLVYYFGFVKKRLGRRVLIAWNIMCILLLLNVVTMAVLSLPARYSQFGFEQPNIAIGYFPFVLLPALLVPMVLFASVASIWQLQQKTS